MAFGKKDEAPTGDFNDGESEIIEIHNQYLSLVETPGVTDPKAASLQIVKRILSAGSMEELESMVGAGTASAADFMGVPLWIDQVQWFRSSPAYMENSAGVFVVMTCRRDDDGSTIVITNGGENVIATLYRATELGGLPTAKPWEFDGNQTASGFTVLWLKPSTGPFIQASKRESVSV